MMQTTSLRPTNYDFIPVRYICLSTQYNNLPWPQLVSTYVPSFTVRAQLERVT